MKKIITIIKIVKFFSETNYKKLLEFNTTYPNANFLVDNTIDPSQIGNIGTFSSETRPRNIAMNYIIKY